MPQTSSGMGDVLPLSEQHLSQDANMSLHPPAGRAASAQTSPFTSTPTTPASASIRSTVPSSPPPSPEPYTKQQLLNEPSVSTVSDAVPDILEPGSVPRNSSWNDLLSNHDSSDFEVTSIWSSLAHRRRSRRKAPDNSSVTGSNDQDLPSCSPPQLPTQHITPSVVEPGPEENSRSDVDYTDVAPLTLPAPTTNPFGTIASSAAIEWELRKQRNDEQNCVIDELMGYVGLEEVKWQFLAIKSKVDVCKEQGRNPKKERFNIIFQGNPGTG